MPLQSKMTPFFRSVVRSLFVWLLAGLMVAGCKTETKKYSTQRSPEAPQNWFLPSGPGRPMRRVALLPVWNERYTEAILRDIDIAFGEELSKKALFEVVPITRGDLEGLIGLRSLASYERISGDLFLRIKDRYGVDGVMFSDVTYYSPYKPVGLGIRSKLVDIESGRIHWASDVVYDSGNAGVADAAKSYQKVLGKDNFMTHNDGATVLLSPKLFVKFAAYSNFASLQR